MAIINIYFMKYFRLFENFKNQELVQDNSLVELTKYYKNNYSETDSQSEEWALSNYIGNGYIKIRQYLNSGGDTNLSIDDISKINRYFELNSELEVLYKDLKLGTKMREKNKNEEFYKLKKFYQDNHTQIIIYGLSNYIKNNKIKDDLLLYRGIIGEDGTNYFKSLKVGDTYTEKSFSSTSILKLKRFDNDFNISIEAKKGKNVANIGNDSEFEYLIDYNSKFKVLDTQRNSMVVELL